MAKYKVVFDRAACIGAAACAAVLPEVYVMKDDNKPDITGATGDAEKQELIIEESELERHLEAARVCPVTVIHIYNMDTGEQLV